MVPSIPICPRRRSGRRPLGRRPHGPGVGLVPRHDQVVAGQARAAGLPGRADHRPDEQIMIRPPRSSTTRPRTRASRSRRQHAGVVMVTCLFILLVITLLAVAMYRSTGLHEDRGQHPREGAVVPCGQRRPVRRMVARAGSSGSRRCVRRHRRRQHRQQHASLRGRARDTGRGPVGEPGQLCAAEAGRETRRRPDRRQRGCRGRRELRRGPGLYIQYLGLGPDPRQSIYRVTGAAYGGVASTISVVQSTYAISARTLDLGGL